MPSRRQDIRRLVTQCLLVCAPPGIARQGPPAAPDEPSVDSVARQVWRDWDNGGENLGTWSSPFAEDQGPPLASCSRLNGSAYT